MNQTEIVWVVTDKNASCGCTLAVHFNQKDFVFKRLVSSKALTKSTVVWLHYWFLVSVCSLQWLLDLVPVLEIKMKTKGWQFNFSPVPTQIDASNHYHIGCRISIHGQLR